jgi:uncharacterized protein YaaQ
MKLIIAIINDNDNESVSQALVAGGFRVTRIASTGGFFRRGSSTLMTGVADDQVDAAIAALRSGVVTPAEAGASRATLFVLNVENFTQI